ncbi:hypothetical protein C9374_013866 [Naegleria lovaniensis]|uniref:C2 domain-containing protein n=1 Tax=Naegleria lovaniensis TaxID=51637 RepID=A0AA88KQ44_NAELO|nr:uncharacterized protein C9374_013866 [Naegleria lovaniensis]KAG2389306.1 hypothetical protein C9374_013866 [Naegleria lovaniensis]
MSLSPSLSPSNNTPVTTTTTNTTTTTTTTSPPLSSPPTTPTSPSSGSPSSFSRPNSGNVRSFRYKSPTNNHSVLTSTGNISSSTSSRSSRRELMSSSSSSSNYGSRASFATRDENTILVIPSSMLWMESFSDASSKGGSVTTSSLSTSSSSNKSFTNSSSIHDLNGSAGGTTERDHDLTLESATLSVKFNYSIYNTVVNNATSTTTNRAEKLRQKTHLPISVGCFVLDKNGNLVDVLTLEQPKSLITVESVDNIQGLNSRKCDNATLLSSPQMENVTSGDPQNEKSSTRNTMSSSSRTSAPTLHERCTPLLHIENEVYSVQNEADQRKSLGLRRSIKSSSSEAASATTPGASANLTKASIGGYHLRTGSTAVNNAHSTQKTGSFIVNNNSVTNSPESQFESSTLNDPEMSQDSTEIKLQNVKQTFVMQIRNWKHLYEPPFTYPDMVDDMKRTYWSHFKKFLDDFTVSTTSKKLITPTSTMPPGTSSEDSNAPQKNAGDSTFNFCKQAVQNLMFSKHNEEQAKHMAKYLSENPYGEYNKIVFFLEGDLNCLEGDLAVSFENSLEFMKRDYNDLDYRVTLPKYIHQLNVSINQPSVMKKSNIISTLFSMTFDRSRKDFVIETADPLSTCRNYSSLSCQPYPLPYQCNLFHLPKIIDGFNKNKLDLYPLRGNQCLILQSKSDSTTGATTFNGETIRIRLTEENRALGIRPIRVNHYCLLLDSQGSILDVVCHDKTRSSHNFNGKPTVTNHLAESISGNCNVFVNAFDYFDINMENLKHVPEVYILSVIGDGYEKSEIPKMGLANTAINNISSFLYFDSMLGIYYLDSENNEVGIRNFSVSASPSNCIIWCKMSYTGCESFAFKTLGETITLSRRKGLSVLTEAVHHLRRHYFKPSKLAPCPSIFELTQTTLEGETVSTLETPIQFSVHSPLLLKFKGISHSTISENSKPSVLLNVFLFDHEAYFLKKHTVELKREGPLLDGIIDPMAIIPKLVEKTHALFCVISIYDGSREMKRVSFEDEAQIEAEPSVQTDLRRLSFSSSFSNSKNESKNDTIRMVSVLNASTKQPQFTFPLSEVSAMAQVVNENNVQVDIDNQAPIDHAGYKHLLGFKLEKVEGAQNEWQFSFIGEWMPITQEREITVRDKDWIYRLSDLYLVNNPNYQRSTNEKTSHAPLLAQSQYICFGVKFEDINKKLSLRSDICPLTSGKSKKAMTYKHIAENMVLKMEALCYNWKGDMKQTLTSSSSMPLSGTVEKYISEDTTRFAAVIDQGNPSNTKVEWPVQGEHDDAQFYIVLDDIRNHSLDVGLKRASNRLSIRRNKSAFALPDPNTIIYFSILLKIHLEVSGNDTSPDDVNELLTQLNALLKIYNMETKNEDCRFSIPAVQIPFKTSTTSLSSSFFLCSIKCQYSSENKEKAWHITPILQRRQASEIAKYLAPIPKVLQVQIMEASQLPVMDTISGMCDGFVTVYMIESEEDFHSSKKKKLFKTNTIKKNLNPKWNNEVFTINIHDHLNKLGLLFTVSDRDMLSTEVIGHVFIPWGDIENRSAKFYSILKNVSTSTTVPSSPLSASGQFLGKLRIRFELLGAAKNNFDQPLELIKSTLKKIKN